MKSACRTNDAADRRRNQWVAGEGANREAGFKQEAAIYEVKDLTEDQRVDRAGAGKSLQEAP